MFPLFTPVPVSYPYYSFFPCLALVAVFSLVTPVPSVTFCFSTKLALFKSATLDPILHENTGRYKKLFKTIGTSVYEE